MTDDNDIPRRKLLLAGAASPAVFGISISALENASRSEMPSLASAQTQGNSVSITGFDDANQGFDSPTAIVASSELFDSSEGSEGRQIRLEYDGERALYTLDSETAGGDNTAQLSEFARCRLDTGSYPDQDPGTQGCPEHVSDCGLAEQSFDATFTTDVTVDQSPDEAEENGELIEQATEGTSDLLVIAPHGGQIEPHTDDQAAVLSNEFDETPATWRCMGWRPGGGAFRRWHVPSDELQVDSFSELPGLVDGSPERAVSFHGNCPNGVRIGGGADESVRTSVRDSIDDVLPNDESVQLADGRFRNADSSVLVNQVTDDGNGVWVGQSLPVREDHWENIAIAVGSVLLD